MFHLQRMKNRPGFFYLAAFIGLILLFLYLALPLLALFLKTTPEEILLTLTEPFVIQSLTLSLFTTVITTIVLVIIGTPVAFIQSRYPYPGKKIVDTFIDLPLVLPPAVAGLALLLLWGRMVFSENIWLCSVLRSRSPPLLWLCPSSLLHPLSTSGRRDHFLLNLKKDMKMLHEPWEPDRFGSFAP